MATEPEGQPLSKRKAQAFIETAAPPLSHFFGSAEQRKQANRYWIKDNIGNGFDLLVHFGLKLLTMDGCSNFGAKLGPVAIPRFNKSAIKRGRATLARLLPEKTQAER